MSQKIGVGIIGCGGIAAAKHIPNLLLMPDAEIRALCDPVQPARAAALRDRFQLSRCKVCGSYEEMLALEEVAAVHVCTPNGSHAPLSIQALRAGKHVMCEKPMSVTLEEAEAMSAAAKSADRLLTVCANNRFRKDSWHLKRLCDRGDLGKIYFAKAHALRRRGVPVWGSFLDKSIQGGGPVLDIGTHALDMALWMMNNYSPRMVLGKTYNYLGRLTSAANPHGNWKSGDFTVEDSGFGMILMENGATILLEASWALNLRDEKAGKVTLCGTLAGADMDGGLFINGEHEGMLYNKEIVLSPPPIPQYEAPCHDGPRLEMELWIDSIQTGRPPVTQPEQMITVLRILNGLYESDRTGKPVYF